MVPWSARPGATRPVIRTAIQNGRLAEIEFSGAISTDDVGSFTYDMRTAATQCQRAGSKLLCVTDMRRVITLDDGAVDALVWLMRRDNSAQVVSAFLADSNKRAVQQPSCGSLGALRRCLHDVPGHRQWRVRRSGLHARHDGRRD